MRNNKKNGISIMDTIRLNWRGIKELHGLQPQLFPSLCLQAAASAATPYALIFFSARILNELAGMRRSAEIWKWVAITVIITGILAIMNALLTSWKNIHVAAFWAGRDRIYSRKMFSMDFADMDKQSTHDLFTQIHGNWSNYGLPRLMDMAPDIVRAIVGIISAIALTVSLFTKSVPSGAGKLTILNNPLFVLVLLGVMLLISNMAGRLAAYVSKREMKLAGEMTLGNRIFSYFSALSNNKERATDVRMNNQVSLAMHYFDGILNAFGARGLMAKLSYGAGGVADGTAASLSAVFTGIVYVFTCLKALGGAFGIGSVTQYVGAVTALSGNLTTLFKAAGQARSNAEVLKKTFMFLDIPNSMYQGSLTTEKRADRKYEVEFKDVSFKYPGTDTWALRHVNIKFEIGRRLAVVGENGSGKTTFIKLLCRLYDPQEGEILLNGIDIRKYNYRDYMDIFSVVFQDYQLLSQPLGANVAGSAEYDRARALKALNDAGFGDRLKTLPDGLDTQLYNEYSDNGVEISGGEAQKIAIARALYKNAPFLILDEPTAALDPIAEAEIYAQLNQIVDDRTAIYISHRLSSCRFCDEIIVFDHGRIIQRGAHDALVSKNGKYNQLWNAQAQYYE